MLIFFQDSTVLEMLRASQNGLVFFFPKLQCSSTVAYPAHQGEDHANDLCKDQVLSYTQLPTGDSSHMFQEGQIT